MLAAIGIIIMVKQSYTALGVTAPKGELLESIEHLPVAFSEMNPEVFGIALVALAVLIIHPRLKVKWIKAVPAPLWVLAMTIPLAHGFDLFHEHHYHFMGKDFVLGPKHLVNLPDKISDGVVFPNFGQIATGAFWISAVSIALVSGLESLLSAKAVDAIDPWKRKSNLNKDLLAMGGGSALAAVVGGLPMISEIVRSSANINNGARTQWANFFHGTFLLIFLLLLAPVIEQIPMSALAAMLVFTGFRLAAPREFKNMWKIGPIQFAVFVTTVVVVIATDLLIGIAAGIVLEAVLQVVSGAPLTNLFRSKTVIHKTKEETIVEVHGAIIFTNYLHFKSKVMKAASTPVLTLDMKWVNRIDHTAMHNYHLLETELHAAGIEVRVINMDHLYGVTDHPQSDHVRYQRKESLPKLTRRQLELLQFAGNEGYPYQPVLVGRFREWDSFLMLGGKSIIKVENKITVRQGTCQVTFADLHIRSGAYFTEGETKGTFMHVQLQGATIPAFRIEEETFVDRIRDNVTNEDIDFIAFQAFSDKFLLRGAEESSIREFFTEPRIRFLEGLKGFEMESDGNAILIRSTSDLLPANQIHAWVMMGCAVGEMFSRESAGNTPVEIKQVSGQSVSADSMQQS